MITNKVLIFCLIFVHHVLMSNNEKAYLHQDEYVSILKLKLGNLIAERVVKLERFKLDKRRLLMIASPFMFRYALQYFSDNVMWLHPKDINVYSCLYSWALAIYVWTDLIAYWKLRGDIKAIKQELEVHYKGFDDKDGYIQVTFPDASCEKFSLLGKSE